MKVLGVVFLACLALGYCDDSALPASRILGGAAAPIATFNYVVQVRRDHFGTGTWHQQCGGVLVNVRAVLTSAHCFDGVPDPLRWRINAGSASRTLVVAERLVLNIIYHPNYNPVSLQNNLAIVQLLTAVPLGANIANAPLALATAAIPTGNTQILGWGATVQNGVPSDTLQVATVAVAAHVACVANHALVHRFVSVNNICVGTTTGICTRDEGGPLVFNNVVHGIASFIHDCGNPLYSSVFTRIDPFRTWIDNISSYIIDQQSK